MERQSINLGIFGFGCVGQGLWNVLTQTKGLKANVVRICIKHPEKKRTIDSSFFTTDKALLLNDPNINVIVELIDDADAAFEIVSEALSKGKAVVTANKKMVAEHATELLDLQQKFKVPLLYESACCASIPIIRNLEEYYDNDLLTSVEGVFNGSTNYILSRIFDQNLDFASALTEAQQLGFAELDPSLDIEAVDPAYKLSIIILHAFGLHVRPQHVFRFGITRINDFDRKYAFQHGLTIKLLARCQKHNNTIVAYVIPSFVRRESQFSTVLNEYNGVQVESVFSEKQFFGGKGAGSNPTGSAVLSDISALSYNYHYEYKKLKQNPELILSQDLLLKVYVRFANWTFVNMADFVEITEQFSSPTGNYLKGSITLEKLSKAVWLQNPEVNLILQ